MRRPGQEGGEANRNSLQRVWDMAVLDTQRQGNVGAGLKLLEALMNVVGFRPHDGGKA